jgi:predicted GNAT family acetyltransferase
MTDHRQVIDNTAEHRFELDQDGHKAIAEYRLSDGEIVFTHTLVPPALEGKGVGSALVAGALDQVRRKGLRVVPRCAFVRHYIETHPDTHDLLA